jgi:hypothetical protein
MALKKSEQASYAPQVSKPIASGDYKAQRQLDFRLVADEPLQVVAPGDASSSSDSAVSMPFAAKPRHCS